MASNATTRGLLLQLIYASGPLGCSDTYLVKVLRRAGQEAAIDELTIHLQYLADKDYISRRWESSDEVGEQAWMNRVLPGGVDLCESIGEDKGVRFVR